MVGFEERKGKAQDLCDEIFRKVEGPLGEAWISDDAGTNDAAEYLDFIEGSLLALDDARKIIKAFLRKHRKLRRKR